MLVGSYASADQEGIKAYRFNQETGEAVLASTLSGIENPSFLVPTEDGTHVYAVGETEKGFTANALALDTLTAGLTLLNSQSTGGASPCYITVSPDGKFVLTANYMGANITVFPRLADGKLGEGHVISFQGKGADKERQEQPHLHCVYFTPDGKLLLANDLGLDRIHAFPVKQTPGTKGTDLLDEAAAFDIELAPGSGPRHTCFDKQGKHAYLLTELSGEVVVWTYDGKTLTQQQVIKADTVGAKGSADIHLSPDGKFLYASNRLQADGVAIFKVSPSDGTLTKVGYQLTGIHPRNFTITPNGKYLLVACRDTNEIQVFARNREITRMNASQLINYLSQCTIGRRNLENSYAICLQTIGSIQEFSIGRQMNICTTFRTHRVCLDDLLLCQGLSIVRPHHYLARQFRQQIRMFSLLVKTRMTRT
jgi:6-phosphogluconolactonase (cycloisomerase 2 family)